jgi:Pyruvate/2-oxoacid:ferredoxin oxidoreductase delta subunit
MLQFADVVFDGVRNVTARSDLCLRVRFRKSACTRCVDVCAEGVIALDPGPTVRRHCAACGLCVTACPTEALRDADQDDEELLDRLLSGLPHEDEDDAPRGVAIRCDRVSGDDGAMRRMPCVGRLTETVIVGVALSGASRLEVVRGRCAECRLRHGGNALARSIGAARPILSALGRDAFEIETREQDHLSPNGVTRRSFFATLSGRAWNRTPALASESATLPREACGRRAILAAATGHESRRALLIDLLQRTGADWLRPVQSGCGFPWAKVRIDEARCVACPTCASLCPSGAIVQRIEDDRAVLTFTGARCGNCGLCAEACPARAIALDTEASVAEALHPEPVVVATIRLSWCAACGDVMGGEAGGLCITCRRRRVSPV